MRVRDAGMRNGLGMLGAPMAFDILLGRASAFRAEGAE